MKKILLLIAAITIQASAFAAEEKPAEKEIIISPKQLALSSLADVVEDLLPAVVNIAITSNVSATQEFGAGFIISKEGLLVTNNHVIDEASEISVVLNSGEKYKAKIPPPTTTQPE